MITREHIGFNMDSRATYSDCEKYRYSLKREFRADMWGAPRKPGKFLCFIMLNPSTATEEKNDPTVERCMTRAINGGFSGVIVYNLFAFRATDPRDMRAALDPIGRDNDAFIADALENVKHHGHEIICGWGTHGTFMQRNLQVINMFERYGVQPMALRVTKEGHPAHPLYLPYNLEPVPLRKSVLQYGDGQ